MDEVKRLEALKDQEINEAKKILAYEATKICRGEQEAKAAQDTAIKTFEQGATGGDLPSVKAQIGDGILDVFVNIGFCSSKGEARRLIKQGGLKLNDKSITDENYHLSEDDFSSQQAKIALGKKKFGIITLGWYWYFNF